jgi:hypothetical protein
VLLDHDILEQLEEQGPKVGRGWGHLSITLVQGASRDSDSAHGLNWVLNTEMEGAGVSLVLQGLPTACGPLSQGLCPGLTSICLSRWAQDETCRDRACEAPFSPLLPEGPRLLHRSTGRFPAQTWWEHSF